MINILCILDSFLYHDCDKNWLMKVPLKLLDEGKIIFYKRKFYKIINIYISDLLTICIVEDYSDKECENIKIDPKRIDGILLDHQIKLLENRINKNKENNND